MKPMDREPLNGRRKEKTARRYFSALRYFSMKVSLGDLKYLRRIGEGYFRTIPAAPNIPDPGHWRDDQLTLSWLGHATVLLNFFGVWILTDPAMRARVGIRVGPLTFG